MSNRTHKADEFFYDNSFGDYDNVALGHTLLVNAIIDVERTLEQKIEIFNELRTIRYEDGVPCFSVDFLRRTLNLD